MANRRAIAKAVDSYPYASTAVSQNNESSDRFWKLISIGFSAPGAVGVFRCRMSSSNHIFALIVSVVWMLTSVGFLTAQTAERPPTLPILDALDIDGDGILSSDEIENSASSLRQLDRNSDGQLRPDEMFSSNPRRQNGSARGELQPSEKTPNKLQVDELVERFFYGDVNNDGVLSKEEIPEQVRDHLLTGDANGDDAVDRVELQRILKIRLNGTSKEPEKADALTSDNKVDEKKTEAGENVTPGEPLTIRILDGLDTLVIKGNAADVAAIREAFDKARQSLGK